MNITEILITGYDGDSGLFATSLTPGHARTILTTTDDEGNVLVDSVREQATPEFAAVREILGNLGITSASTETGPACKSLAAKGCGAF